MLASLETRWLGPLFADTRNRPGPAGDFFAVYHAGRQIITGLSPYAKPETPKVTPPFAPFRYPPGVAFVLGVPLTILPPWIAYVFWIAVLESLLVLALILARRRFEDHRMADLVSAAWLLFTPYFLELWMGQFTFFAAVLTFLALEAWDRRRSRVGDLLWSAASALKIFPLALAPAVLKARRLRALVTCALVLALALVWFLWHPNDWREFSRLNGSEPDLRSFHAGNLGLQAFAYRLVAVSYRPLQAAEWRWVALAMTIGLAGITAAAALLPRRPDARVTAALALLLLPLVSKHAWEHHYVVALPAMTLLAIAWQGSRQHLFVLAVCYLVICLPTPIVFWQDKPSMWDPEVAWPPMQRAAYHAGKPLAALALFATAASAAFRRTRPT